LKPGGAGDTYRYTRFRPTPTFLLDLAGAGHFAWTDLHKTYQARINAYALAFFARYLKGTADPFAHLLSPPWPKDVSSFKYALK